MIGTPYLRFNVDGNFIEQGIAFTRETTPPEAPFFPTGAVQCTDEQYAAASIGTTLVNGGIVIGSPPALSLAEQASNAVRAGLTITVVGSVTIPATPFPTDPITTGKIGQVITAINATGSFPGGASTYPIKDASGAWHTLTVDQYRVVAAAIAAYVAPLDLIIDGNPLGATELPPNSVSLTV